MLKFMVLFVTTFISVSTVFGQAAPPPTANPNYDASLAAKLGADERGMKMYVMCLLATRSIR